MGLFDRESGLGQLVRRLPPLRDVNIGREAGDPTALPDSAVPGLATDGVRPLPRRRPQPGHPIIRTVPRPDGKGDGGKPTDTPPAADDEPRGPRRPTGGWGFPFWQHFIPDRGQPLVVKRPKRGKGR